MGCLREAFPACNGLPHLGGELFPPGALKHFYELRVRAYRCVRLLFWSCSHGLFTTLKVLSRLHLCPQMHLGKVNLKVIGHQISLLVVAW